MENRYATSAIYLVAFDLLALAVSATLPTFAFATETRPLRQRGMHVVPSKRLWWSAYRHFRSWKSNCYFSHWFAASVPGITLDGTGRTNGQDVNMLAMIIAACWFLSMVFARERIRTPEWHFSRSGADQACWDCSGPSALLYGSGALGGVISYDRSMQKIYCRKDKAVVFVSLVWRHGGP